MKRSLRTLTIGLVAGVIALAGGAFVASASNHASFASSSSAQNDRGGFGGGPPQGGQFPPRPNN
jgi:hypothetical protein